MTLKQPVVVGFEMVSMERLVPFDGNPRRMSERGMTKLRRSIREFGFVAPVLAQVGTGMVIAGHQRMTAAKLEGHTEAPTMWVDMDRATALAYNVADNRLAEEAEWDDEKLAELLQGVKLEGIDLTLTGFEPEQLDSLLEHFGGSGQLDDLTGTGTGTGGTGGDLVPEPPADPISQRGDVWVLGRHRVMCGDSTDPLDVAKLMDGQQAHLVHADPPYGMGKEKEGVANDNLYGPKLDAFQMAWWRAYRPHVRDNASAYIWGNAPDLWRLWYQGGLADSERLTFRNEIVWSKGSAGAAGITHMGADFLRQYPNETERCLFFMLGEQSLSNNADSFWEGFEPIRAHLEGEAKRMGWGPSDIKRLCGVGMYSHWFSRSQWVLIPRNHYETLQKAAEGAAFTLTYDEILNGRDGGRDGLEALRQGFYASRAYFDNTHELMTDVWKYPRVMGEERHGHATPKPVPMMVRAIKSSCPPDGLVVEPFGGSGSTLAAAEQAGRTCYCMELSPAYVDVIVKRWQSMTGQEVHSTDGRPFTIE